MKTKTKFNCYIYHGYTHFIPRFLFWFWKFLFCRFGWHLWDEVISWRNEHYLSCDACYETLYIKDKSLDKQKEV